jgi:hypothetical protein
LCSDPFCRWRCCHCRHPLLLLLLLLLLLGLLVVGLVVAAV